MSTETQPTNRRSKREVALRGGVALVIVGLIFAYLLSILSFAISGGSEQVAGDPPVKDGVNFSFDLATVEPAKNQITLRTIIAPAGSYFDAETGEFAKTIVVTARFRAGGSVTQTIEAGTPVGSAINYDLYVYGNPVSYPFDQYRFGLPSEATPDPDLETEVNDPAPLVTVYGVEADGTTVDRKTNVPIGLYPPGGLQAWTETWQFEHRAPGEILLLLTIKRGGGGIAFVLVVLALMVTGAILSGLVAWAVARKRRIIEATMAGWFAALLFAVVPLRINLPGAPPIGVWMDVLVFYWVVMALMVAMAVFIGSWLKYRKAPEE